MVIPYKNSRYYTYRIFFVKQVFHRTSLSPIVRKDRHLEFEETQAARSSRPLISETFFYYGSSGLL